MHVDDVFVVTHYSRAVSTVWLKRRKYDAQFINANSETRMDWLKNIVHILPLEAISDILGEVAIWWGQMVKDVPPADLPMYAYLGGVVIVLVLWLLVARMLPKPIGGMSWMLLFAVLLAPGTALNDPSVLAPASIHVVYSIMMKDFAGAIAGMVPILVVLVAGLFVGFIWQLIRGAFESSLDKARRSGAEDTQATMQLTTGSYLPEGADVIESSDVAQQSSKTPLAAKSATEVSLNKDGGLTKKAKTEKSDEL